MSPRHQAGFRPSLAAGLLLGATLTGVGAQSVYTCTDAKGRKLTSDRPIIECIDREQIELNPNGTVRRRLAPTPTGQELAAEAARQREAAAQRARQAEEQARIQAVLKRYPNRAAHDAEQAKAIAQIDELIKAAKKRLGELQQERKAIEVEMEFYVKDPSRAPARLKQQITENERSVGVQDRFIAEQEAEKKRVNARYDAKLAELQKLWALSSPSPPRPAASKPAR
jgi:chromosome segregation ATPase